LFNPIVRRTLLFPDSSAPAQLAGLPVTVIAPTTAQSAQGIVTVATEFDPRAVKAFVNDGHSRYYGGEALLQFAINSTWQASANYSFICGHELNPSRYVRRLPPQMGSLAVRYAPRRRFWVEVIGTAAGEQNRLSGGDLDDERIGASRRRADIADFFHGTRISPYIDSLGRFAPTGETLPQIQDRVLPIGAVINGVLVLNDGARVPLYTSTPDWLTLGLRTGVPLGERLTFIVAITNLLDKNYRLHGSGLDSPGTNLYAGFRYVF
jgi:outer membrane receptor protein involved in Fe transport